MKIENVVIALVLSTLMFTGLFLFVKTTAENNSITFNDTIYKVKGGTVDLAYAFSNLNNSKVQVDNIVNTYNSTQLQDTNSLFSFAVMTKDSGNFILSSILNLKDILYITSEILGIPPIFITGMIVIVMIVIILSLLYILTGR